MDTEAKLRSIAGRMCRQLKAVYPDLGTAVKRAVCVERRIDPQPDSAAAYEERYRLYKQICPTLISL